MTKENVEKIEKPENSEKPEPHNFEQTRIAQATEFSKAKAADGKIPPRIEIKGFSSGGRLKVETPHTDNAGHLFALNQAFGTGSCDFQQQQLGRLMAIVRSKQGETPDELQTNSVIAAVAAVEPQNEVEGMLAVQMAATHEVAMEMLSRAKVAGSTEHLERYGTLATKLLRTYTTQIEALSKLRRGGAQKVTVEHVHVYEGGQAIVGNVNGNGSRTLPGGGGPNERGHQPHALAGPAALALQADPSMLRPDAGRDPVHVAGREGEEAMPDARRGERDRGSEG
ncbi:hypothetical protein [Methylobacterium sp.]|uniref:hypothetical protein n=1 Tax=Methylobacterium sp. TaxID=409 RepID=UPI0015C94E6A|nr:hypothetical protein [Methylobacterium sp.]